MQINFKDKLAIVTGGTRGIGATVSKQLSELGATVIATGTNSEKINELNNSPSKHKNISYLQLDFNDQNSIQKAFAKLKKIDRIDILINNAGVNKINSIWDTEDDDWDWLQTVNLKGVFLITKLAAQKMKEQKNGRIVNIASIFGVVSKAQRAPYSTSKSGLIGFTRAVGLDLAPYNVLVNALSPGFVMTELTKNILSQKDMDELVKSVPLQRFAEPQEIVNTILYLASDLNTYLTGQNIIVDGGFVSA